MTTVHLVLNSHLDPIWLWPQRDGLDEVLNTCRYVSALLDRHSDVIYTRGEAWVYQQLQRLDPALFAAIREQVARGQWSPVGGWYVQPDCNLPSGFAMERQIEMGKRLFLEYFGNFPRIAYNVDSFGHAASLPEMMRRAGQDCYVMMRPQEHEMALPCRLFRWRGYEDGPEVTTFRVAKSYCTQQGITEEHVLASLSDLPSGVNHTMCFVGIGDHGGGPTEEMIDWCRSHRDAFPGVRLEFSSPERFFASIRDEIPHLPLQVGELQMHAVGCYSVVRRTKVLLRKAEHRLIQAEIALHHLAPGSTVPDAPLREAWEKVCFHHFHDTLGGTSLPSAYEEIDADLGLALSRAEEHGSHALRRHVVGLPGSPWQQVVFFNASELPFSGPIEFEPWLEWSEWQPEWRLVDEENRVIPHQLIATEALFPFQVRLLMELDIPPKRMRIVRIATANDLPPSTPTLDLSSGSIRSDIGTSIGLDSPGFLSLPHLGRIGLPFLRLLKDPSDTWSHGITNYSLEGALGVEWAPPTKIDEGPLMASLTQAGTIGKSEVAWEWRSYSRKPWIDGLFRVQWCETFKVLKLAVPLPGAIGDRFDGIPGGSLRRTDARELPLRDWTSVRIGSAPDAPWLAVISPDVFAIDVQEGMLHFTLLRSPIMAWHDPSPASHPRRHFSDRGEHFFRFRLIGLPEIDTPLLDRIAHQMQRPPLTASTTRGMKTRALRSAYQPEPLV